MSLSIGPDPAPQASTNEIGRVTFEINRAVKGEFPLTAQTAKYAKELFDAIKAKQGSSTELKGLAKKLNAFVGEQLEGWGKWARFSSSVKNFFSGNGFKSSPRLLYEVIAERDKTLLLENAIAHPKKCPITLETVRVAKEVLEGLREPEKIRGQLINIAKQESREWGVLQRIGSAVKSKLSGGECMSSPVQLYKTALLSELQVDVLKGLKKKISGFSEQSAIPQGTLALSKRELKERLDLVRGWSSNAALNAKLEKFDKCREKLESFEVTRNKLPAGVFRAEELAEVDQELEDLRSQMLNQERLVLEEGKGLVRKPMIDALSAGLEQLKNDAALPSWMKRSESSSEQLGRKARELEGKFNELHQEVTHKRDVYQEGEHGGMSALLDWLTSNSTGLRESVLLEERLKELQKQKDEIQQLFPEESVGGELDELYDQIMTRKIALFEKVVGQGEAKLFELKGQWLERIVTRGAEQANRRDSSEGS